MRGGIGRLLAVWTLAGLCLSACAAELPSDVHVDVLPLQAKEVTLADLQSAFAGADLTPPLYSQSPGTSLYAIVVPFDIPWLPEAASSRHQAVGDTSHRVSIWNKSNTKQSAQNILEHLAIE